MKRNLLFDSVKGLGICLVVYGHSTIVFGHYLIYMFHMPLFFFISGALHHQRGLYSAFKSKFRSLLIPFFYFLLFSTLVDIFLHGTSVLQNFHLFHTSGSAGPLWFLPCLFQVTLLFNLIMLLSARFTIFICILFSLFGYYLSSVNCSLPFLLDSSFSMLMFYALGYYFRKFIDNGCSRVSLNLLTISSALFFVLSYVIQYKLLHLDTNAVYENKLTNNYFLFVVSALFGICFCFCFCFCKQCMSIKAKYQPMMRTLLSLKHLFVNLGVRSLFIFALHQPVFNILFHFLPTTNIFQKLIFMCISLFLSYHLAFLFPFFHKNTLALKA